MDLSKLPKMSDTRQAETDRQRQAAELQADQPQPPAPPVADYQSARVVAMEAGSGGGWISIVVGVLLILFQPRFWQWVAHKLFGSSFTWTFSDVDGSPLPYEKTVFFPGDLAVSLFAMALVVEGIVQLIAPRSRPAIWFSLLIVGAATALNLLFLGYMLARGQGLQLFSAIAVVIGIFMVVQQWQMLFGPRRRYLIVEEQ